MGQGQRQFTDEFKREAVALPASSGRPLTQIAAELGIAPWMFATGAVGAEGGMRGRRCGPTRRRRPRIPPGPGGRRTSRLRRENDRLRMKRDIKKNCGHLLGTTEMRFRQIEDQRGIWPVRIMCDALSVSASGYYAWRSRPESARKIANRGLLDDIQRVHAHHRERYGAPRIHAELRAEGQIISRKRIERVMRGHGIRARAPRRYRVCTTEQAFPAGGGKPTDQNFVAKRPNQVWLADITYIPTGEGWLYLAVILDLFTRKVVGWAMREHMRAELTIAALTMAIQRRRPGPGLTHHSDAAVSTLPATTAISAGRRRHPIDEPQGELLG